MKNAEQPINPTMLRQLGENEFRIASEKDLREGIYLSSHLGLTKREYFAAMAMQGMFSQTGFLLKDAAELARVSIQCADEILNQLEK